MLPFYTKKEMSLCLLPAQSTQGNLFFPFVPHLENELKVSTNSDSPGHFFWNVYNCRGRKQGAERGLWWRKTEQLTGLKEVILIFISVYALHKWGVWWHFPPNVSHIGHTHSPSPSSAPPPYHCQPLFFPNSLLPSFRVRGDTKFVLPLWLNAS